ncbi:MAG: hypothetical protein ACR2RB_01050 [Gammaproteobacteria bacterium]
MSMVKEILERLSGVHVVGEKLNMTMDTVDKLADRLIDHERRLVRLETLGEHPKHLPKSS